GGAPPPPPPPPRAGGGEPLYESGVRLADHVEAVAPGEPAGGRRLGREADRQRYTRGSGREQHLGERERVRGRASHDHPSAGTIAQHVPLADDRAGIVLLAEVAAPRARIARPGGPQEPAAPRGRDPRHPAPEARRPPVAHR